MRYERILWSAVRGWPVYGVEENGELVYRYADTDEICDENERPCRRCGRLPTEEGHDACLGHIPGVVNACCGHGVEDPYVMMENGTAFHMSGLYPEYSNPYMLSYLAKESGIQDFDDPELIKTGDNILILGIIDKGTKYLCTPLNALERFLPYVQLEDGKQSSDVDSEDTLVNECIAILDTKFRKRAYALFCKENVDAKQRSLGYDELTELCTFLLPSVPEAALMCNAFELCAEGPVPPFWTAEFWADMVPYTMSSASYNPRVTLVSDPSDVRVLFECPVNRPDLLLAMNQLLAEYDEEHFHMISGDGEFPVEGAESDAE